MVVQLYSNPQRASNASHSTSCPLLTTALCLSGRSYFSPNLWANGRAPLFVPFPQFSLLYYFWVATHPGAPTES